MDRKSAPVFDRVHISQDVVYTFAQTQRTLNENAKIASYRNNDEFN